MADAAGSTPAGRELIVMTNHLPWGAEATRLAQVRRIDAVAAGLRQRSPAAGVCLTGDFNTEHRGGTLGWLPEARVAEGTSTNWTDARAAGGSPERAPKPADPCSTRTARASGIGIPDHLLRRSIDYILVRGWCYVRPGGPVSTLTAGADAADT